MLDAYFFLPLSFFIVYNIFSHILMMIMSSLMQKHVPDFDLIMLQRGVS